MNTPNKESGKESGYEAIVTRLEQVIKALESDDLDLDQSLKLYEEGAELYQKAQEMLCINEKKAMEIINILEESSPQSTLDDLKEE